MPYTLNTPQIGAVGATDIDLVAPGLAPPAGGSGRWPQMGAVCTGWDAAIGGGEFMYVRFAGAVTVGQWVSLTFSLTSGILSVSATPWTGTANTGTTLGVAIVAGATGQYGWVQVGGVAVANTTGSPVAGNAVYYGAATGVARPTANAGAQVLNATYASAPSVAVTGYGTLSATQALVMLNRPFAQGAIT